MKTPITLITGYLGSGKTTLLRNILDSADRKIAVLMNEFGQISIDSKIIRGKNVDMMELKGGCVCCSLTGEFEAAVREIRDKVKPDLIVIETTGVAEPDAIIGDITENIEGVRLDAVVTLVDADSMIRFPNLGYTGRMQIEMADVILLNKVDLVSDSDLQNVQNVMRAVNPNAPVFLTVQSNIDLDLILDLRISDRKIVKREHAHSIEETGMGHFVFEGGKMDKQLLEEFLYDVPKDIVRAKGFVITEEGPLLMNFVFGRFDFEPFEAESTQLVFIGRHIDRHRDGLEERLKECEIE